MTASTTVFLAACSATAALAVGITEGTPAENWTIIGLLAAVVLGVGGRMVAALDKNTVATTAMSVSMTSSTAATASLVLELRTLIQQQTQAHADYAQARERAVADLKAHIGEAVREAAAK